MDENAHATETLKALGDMAIHKKDNSCVLIFINGDLSQNARKDEYGMYKSAIAPFSEHVYDTIGNHDETPTPFFNALGCPWSSSCISRGYILNHLDRKRELPLLFSQKCGALYIFQNMGIYFIQLGVGINRAGALQDTAYFNYESLNFLKYVLENKVEPYWAPVVISMHIPMPEPPEILSQYNIIALFFAHTHNQRLISNSHPYLFFSGAARNRSYFDITFQKNYLQVNWPDEHKGILFFDREPSTESDAIEMDVHLAADFGNFPENSSRFVITDADDPAPQLLFINYPSRISSRQNILSARYCYINLDQGKDETRPTEHPDFVTRCFSFPGGTCPKPGEGYGAETLTSEESFPSSWSYIVGATALIHIPSALAGVCVPCSILALYRCWHRYHEHR